MLSREAGGHACASFDPLSPSRSVDGGYHLLGQCKSKHGRVPTPRRRRRMRKKAPATNGSIVIVDSVRHTGSTIESLPTDSEADTACKPHPLQSHKTPPQYVSNENVPISPLPPCTAQPKQSHRRDQ